MNSHNASRYSQASSKRHKCTLTADISASTQLSIVGQVALVTAYGVLAALIAGITPAYFADGIAAMLAIARVTALIVIYAYAVGIAALAAIAIEIRWLTVA